MYLGLVKIFWDFLGFSGIFWDFKRKSLKSLKSKVCTEVRYAGACDFTDHIESMRNNNFMLKLYFAPTELTFLGQESCRAMPRDNLSLAYGHEF